jgi:thioredoxin reductase (NADPH)
MNRQILSTIFAVIMLVGVISAVNWYSQKNIIGNQLDISIGKILDKERIVPVVIIGSGPAGLSAALYTARGGKYTVVFEGKQPGGQLTTTTYVENWPGTKKMLGTALIDDLRKQAQEAGAVMVRDLVECVDFSTWPFKIQTEEGHVINALAVDICTGAESRKLGAIGEEKYWGRGVTTCAVCDAPFYKNKDVVVVGGGDSAVEEATLLTNYAKSVTMLVRGDKLRASASMQNRLKDHEKIRILYNTKITEIKGDDQTVTSVELQNTKDNRSYTIPIDGVFLAIGHIPNTKLFKNFIATDSEGYIELANKRQSKRSQATSVPGVFAAGDVCDFTYRQAGVAAGDGIKAGMDALEFLDEHGYNEHVAKQIADNLYDPELEGDLAELNKLVTLKDFQALAEEKKPLIIEVGAEWCSTCKALLPIMQSIAAKFEAKANFAYIDLDDDPKELVDLLKLKVVPTILVIKNGTVVSRYESKVFSKTELYTLVKKSGYIAALFFVL